MLVRNSVASEEKAYLGALVAASLTGVGKKSRPAGPGNPIVWKRYSLSSEKAVVSCWWRWIRKDL